MWGTGRWTRSCLGWWSSWPTSWNSWWDRFKPLLFPSSWSWSRNFFKKYNAKLSLRLLMLPKVSPSSPSSSLMSALTASLRPSIRNTSFKDWPLSLIMVFLANWIFRLPELSDSLLNGWLDPPNTKRISSILSLFLSNLATAAMLRIAKSNSFLLAFFSKRAMEPSPGWSMMTARTMSPGWIASTGLVSSPMPEAAERTTALALKAKYKGHKSELGCDHIRDPATVATFLTWGLPRADTVWANGWQKSILP